MESALLDLDQKFVKAVSAAGVGSDDQQRKLQDGAAALKQWRNHDLHHRLYAQVASMTAPAHLSDRTDGGLAFINGFSLGPEIHVYTIDISRPPRPSILAKQWL